MSANEDNALTWLEQLMSDTTPASRRAEIEARLAGTEAGRRALARVQMLRLEPPADDVDVETTVMARLPDGPLALYRDMAAVVVRAWADPAFREVLRRDPRATLAAEGVALPPGVAIRVVGATEAGLPGPAEVTLPLPAAAQRAIAADEAVCRLRRTPFGWIWGVPWAAPAPTEAGASFADRVRAWLARPRGVALALAGTAAAIAIWVATRTPGAGPVSGTAAGDGALGPAAAAAVVLALVAGAAYWAHRRG